MGMKQTCSFRFLICFFLLILAPALVARAGGGRSFGSRGSRGFSSPGRTSPGYSAPQNTQSRTYQPYQQPNTQNRSLFGGGGFLQNFGAGLAGGLVGNLLFRSFGGGGMGFGGGGGGMGLLDILLICGVGFFIFRLFRKRMGTANYSSEPPYATATAYPSSQNASPAFESAFPSSDPAPSVPLMEKEKALDIFFKIQNAFTHRDLSSVKELLTLEASGFLQSEIDTLKFNRQINRLENIAVRDVEVSEQWHEMGQEYVTFLLNANVIDYTIDESSQVLIKGSKTEPVKFQEYWTFSRPEGALNVGWKLTAIQQG